MPALIAGVVQPASAQDYPSRPVRIVVPFAPGAGNDLLGRIVAAELTKRLGGQVFVENKPGAASQLGTDLVAKSPADGYTLLWTASDGLSALPAVKASVPYTIPDDFAFIASLTRIAFVIAANPKVPAKTIQELVAYAKANPGKLNYGSAGIGSAPHLGLALLANAAKIEMVHVPFAGLGPALNAVMAGTVDLSLTTVPFVKPQEDAGTVRSPCDHRHGARPAAAECADLAGVRPAGDGAGVLSDCSRRRTRRSRSWRDCARKWPRSPRRRPWSERLEHHRISGGLSRR